MDGMLPAPPDPGAAASRAASAAADATPVVWLLGKAQAGKTSIAAALTGAGEAGIGFGFRRETTESQLHPWPPPPGLPVLRFLDTPGLWADAGEEAARAAEAMAMAETHAQVVVVALRAEDGDLTALAGLLAQLRRRQPALPVIVAQTRLHDLYPPGAGHLLPYPYTGDEADLARPGVPVALARALAAQRTALAGLPGGAPTFVPIDLTREEAELTPRLYGAEQLLDALGRALPATVAALRTLRDPLRGARLRIILPHALAAAAAEAPPLPFAGLAGATTAQGLMLRAIALRCGLPWDRALVWRFLGVLGPGIALSAGGAAGLRQVLKLVPVVGTAAAAATAFATTWAAGEAAMVLFGDLGRGEAPDPAAVRAAWERGFEEARDWWRTRHG